MSARKTSSALLRVGAVADDRVDAGQGISIPAEWDVVVTGEPGVPGRIDVHVVYDRVLRRLAVASVAVVRDDGHEVVSSTLRKVSVHWILQASGAELVRVMRDGLVLAMSDYIAHLLARTDRARGDDLREATALYRLAVTIGALPLKLVSDGLGVSVSTATRIMTRARNAGIAGPPSRSPGG